MPDTTVDAGHKKPAGIIIPRPTHTVVINDVNNMRECKAVCRKSMFPGAHAILGSWSDKSCVCRVWLKNKR